MRCGFEIKKNKSLFNNLCKTFVHKKNSLYLEITSIHQMELPVRDYIYIKDLSKIHYKFAQIIRNKKLT